MLLVFITFPNLLFTLSTAAQTWRFLKPLNVCLNIFHIHHHSYWLKSMEENVPSNSDGFAITTALIFLGAVSPYRRVLCLLVPQNMLGQDYTTMLLLPRHRLCFPTFWMLLPYSFLIGETPRSLGAGTFLLMCLQCLAQHSPDLCWWILGTHGIQTINNPHSCCIALLILYIRWERVALNLLTVRIIQVYFWQRTFKLPYSEKLEGLL